ncbi:MAG: peptidase M28 family protein [Crocinitomicaceae bacterium]|nr:peptidase M28 family protein [Crocinitomicaceae bacterium]|tara:strand:+ start:1451 stop:2743 length:1293 start_codon:yes stop_codon:yes gene_type:complete
MLERSSSYENLRSLCKGVGHRLSGTKSAEEAVKWAKFKLNSYDFDTVYLQEISVPHWERGDVERLDWTDINGQLHITNCTALGGTIGTNGVLSGKIVEINSWDELKQIGRDGIEGKFVFFNRPMNPTYVSTFMAYGNCVDQRHGGAARAAEYGAIGVIVRSMTLKFDNNPHTGSMGYKKDIAKIPAIAISTKDAHDLSEALKSDNFELAKMKLSCKILDDKVSHNVIAEIKGSVYPEKIILVGGHLDSWDIGEGAHDDGAGVVQSIEVLKTFIAMGVKPKHTLRCVLYMNEENGNRGGIGYADKVKKDGETHIFALESDRGGFSPRGYSIDGTPSQLKKIKSFETLLSPYQLHIFDKGYSGVDIGPLKNGSVCLVGLIPDSQRYFDFHHAPTDVFENVNKRELELGAAAITSMVYLIDKYGFSVPLENKK